MKVLKEFRDKYNLQIVYKPGDEFISEDKKRINNLTSRGLIKEIKQADEIKPKKKGR